MKNLSIPALAILIAITFIAQPVVVSVAQYGDGATVGDMIGSRLYNLRGQDLGRIDCVTFDDDGSGFHYPFRLWHQDCPHPVFGTAAKQQVGSFR